MSRPFIPPSECPVCGAKVPPKARACPECGADERSGWDEEAARYDGLDLPDNSAETEKSDSEHGQKSKHAKTRTTVLWSVAAIVLILIFLFGLRL